MTGSECGWAHTQRRTHDAARAHSRVVNAVRTRHWAQGDSRAPLPPLLGLRGLTSGLVVAWALVPKHTPIPLSVSARLCLRR
jgi:hypothetical protein